MIDFRRITPCGECCEGCKKKADGLCHGCLETGGHCDEWAGSGVCPTYACCKEHAVRELTELAKEYRSQSC